MLNWLAANAELTLSDWNIIQQSLRLQVIQASSRTVNDDDDDDSSLLYSLSLRTLENRTKNANE